MKLELTTINLILKNLNSLASLGEVVESKTHEENDYLGSYFVVKITKIKEIKEDLYIKVEDSEDSYSGNYTIDSIQFVKPTKVIVTDFETIK